MMVDDHEMDAEKLKEVMSVISTEIPKLLDALNKQLSNPESAKKMGEVVAQFYKQMIDSGMGPKEAYALTEKFMSSFSLGGMIGKVFAGGKTKDDIDEMVEERIKERIRKKMSDD
ncbi:MAG: hypothetical protein A3K76_02585 [Euryarchaeota archaeon RBG_13_57_23]|nr:MAG: hypothetical protein A3K76_02585 [Euryarchaeota archaeon RBG_13_57_23]